MTPSDSRTYFSQGLQSFLSLVMPITVRVRTICEYIILVMLGPRWHEAIGNFSAVGAHHHRFGLTIPFSWGWLPQGAPAGRYAPRDDYAMVSFGCVIGLRWGPQGVAAGFSISMSLRGAADSLAKHGTLISGADVFKAVIHPLLSIAISATGNVFWLEVCCSAYTLPLLRLGC